MFTYELEENNSVLEVKLIGKIDESSDFSKINVDKYNEIIINFDSVKIINSCGIREWITFLDKLDQKSITYRQCPKIIVDQMSSINGFIPQNTKVESIYLPYYCEKCDIEASVLYKVSDICQNNDIHIPTQKCSECNSEMEFDEIKDIYFLFLKRSKE